MFGLLHLTKVSLYFKSWITIWFTYLWGLAREFKKLKITLILDKWWTKDHYNAHKKIRLTALIRILVINTKGLTTQWQNRSGIPHNWEYQLSVAFIPVKTVLLHIARRSHMIPSVKCHFDLLDRSPSVWWMLKLIWIEEKCSYVLPLVKKKGDTISRRNIWYHLTKV